MMHHTRQSPRLLSSSSSSQQQPNKRAASPRPSSPSFASASSSTSLASSSSSEVSENIRVAVRVRPRTSKEQTAPVAVLVENDQEMIVSRQRFRFDQVFSDTTSQAEIFQSMAAPLVESVCQGTNCALFAYGQTGTGKTFTMLGLDLWQLATGGGRGVDDFAKQLDMLEQNEMRGVIPRAMKYLFSLLQGKPHKVSVSYLEIYNEKILDLLAPAADNATTTTTTTNNLELREDKNGLVQVIDATTKRVNSLGEVLDYLWKGAKNRAVSSTDMNEHSSRSHTIFQVTVEIKHSPDCTTKAKLNLIDLAGSEKWRPHLEFSDQRIAEMTSINQSLSNLGNCVRALLRPGKNHIPYRNSKLTRLVSDSLGGNAKTGFVVTVSPSEMAHEETISTLQFADRAKKVVVRNEANYVETSEMVLKRLELELQRQVKENRELREQLSLQHQQQPQQQPVLLHVARVDEERPPPLSPPSFLSSSTTAGSVASSSSLSLHTSTSTLASSASSMEAASSASSSSVQHALSKALHIHLPSSSASSSSASSLLLSKPEEFLQDYHDHLRNRTSDGLTPMERLALLEWSVTLQAEQLNQAVLARREDAKRIAALHQEVAKSNERCQLSDAANGKLTAHIAELNGKLAGGAAASSQQSVELERQMGDLRRQLVDAKDAAVQRQAQHAGEVDELKRRLLVSLENQVTAHQQQVGSSSTSRGGVTPTITRKDDVIIKSGGGVGGLGRMASTPSRENDHPRLTTTVAAHTTPKQQHQQQQQHQYLTPTAASSHQQEIKTRTFHSSRATPRTASNTTGGITPRTTTSAAAAAAAPPQVWDRFVDEATGRAYFHCKETGQTTWKQPTSSGQHQTIIVRG